MKKLGKTMWVIETENRDGYKTGAIDTKAEAQYRLNEIAIDPFYNCGAQIVSRSNDMIRFSDGSIFKIVKLENCIWIK